MKEFVPKIFNPSDVIRKREKISRRVMSSSRNIKSKDIDKISAEDLKLIFDLYDEAFFEGCLTENFKGQIKFSLSSRMTKSAGKTIFPRNLNRIRQENIIIEIRMATDFFFEYGEIQGEKYVCGIKTDNALEAFLIVFEHELCHTFECINFRNTSCRTKRFKSIAESFFAHTDTYHKLPGNEQIARKKYGFEIGDDVLFAYGDKKLSGKISNINKRATVMVRDSQGAFSDRRGKKYSKYYVFLHNLEE